MRLLLFISLLIVACNSGKHLFHKEDYATEYHYYVGYQEPFIEDTICDHFFVMQSIELEDSTIIYKEVVDAIDYIKQNEGWPCICVYCHLIKQCY